MKVFVFSVLLLVFSISGSMGQTGLTEEEREEIRAEIRMRSAEFWKLSTNDKSADRLERFVDFFVDSDDPAWMGTPALISTERINTYTKEEVKALHQRVFEVRVSTPTTIHEDYFAIISREVVYEICTMEYYFVANNGYRSPDTDAAFSIVWVLRDDQWKILHMTRSIEVRE